MNPEMLSLARELRGLSQTALADGVGINRSLISKYEAGVLEVPDHHHERIATVLSLPEEFFYLKEHRFGVGRGLTYHRKRQDMPRKVLDGLIADMNLSRIHVTRLLRGIDMEDLLPLPRYDAADYDGDASDIARMLRDAWQVPRGPIKDLIQLVELAGCVVIIRPFGTKKIDGINILSTGLQCVIYLNADFPMDRLRFTLAHELGHLIMHTVPTDDPETEANEFAAEFLMPTEDIKVDLRRTLRIDYLMRLKEKWRVSIWALAKRAHDLRCITRQQYKSLCIRMTKAGYRRGDPLRIAPEEPQTLRELFRIHLEELDYDIDELSRFLVMFPDELTARYSVELAGLIESQKRKLRLRDLRLVSGD